MSNTDDSSSRPPKPPDPGATVRIDPSEATRGSGSRADAAGTVRMSPEELDGAAGAAPADPDPGATVRFSPEELARLAQAEAEAEAQKVAEGEDDPLIGTLIRNKWRVLKRLGAGSFGTVYKVQDVKGGWIEALKILGVDRLTGAEAEEMRARFLREAQIMKRLGTESSHIVGLSTYEEDIEAGLIYFLMEFVEGRSLSDALHEEGPFGVERTIRLAKQVCDALMAAHEGPEPVVHRDLKLENLMLTKDRSGQEIVKILDFGIAKIAEKDADSRLTTVGTLGTPGYAAPEQLRAEGVDGRTDLFAFGVILYALLTGRDPWLGHLAHEPTHQIYELMVATDRGEVRPMGDARVEVPPAIVSIIMKLLRRDPDLRFPSARELKVALERVEAGGGDTDAGSLRVLTAEPGVHVEVRSGRQVVASGPTPCVANAIPAGTYTIVVRDPLYSESETTLILGAGAMEDVTLVTSRRADAARKPKPAPRRKRRAARVVAAMALVAGLGAAGYAQPWGRTLDRTALAALIQSGSVTSVWVTDGGLEGGVALAPAALRASIPALEELMTPFFVPVTEGAVPEVVEELRNRGVRVDATWEQRRLTQLAVEAQAASRYYGLAGGDVQSYALRLAALDPGSEAAASLLRKVGERMAWDADAARSEGVPDRADELVQQCLELVPEHPRCVEVSGQR